MTAPQSGRDEAAYGLVPGNRAVSMAMDQDTANLITALCTRVGMIMEDIVDDTLTIGRASAAERTDRLQQLKRASDKIGALVDAALALDA